MVVVAEVVEEDGEKNQEHSSWGTHTGGGGVWLLIFGWGRTQEAVFLFIIKHGLK